MGALGVTPKKYKVSSSTGHKGITFTGQKTKPYKACISFPIEVNRRIVKDSELSQKKTFRYHIGSYTTIKEAVEARRDFIDRYIL